MDAFFVLRKAFNCSSGSPEPETDRLWRACPTGLARERWRGEPARLRVWQARAQALRDEEAFFYRSAGPVPATLSDLGNTLSYIQFGFLKFFA